MLNLIDSKKVYDILKNMVGKFFIGYKNYLINKVFNGIVLLFDV